MGLERRIRIADETPVPWAAIASRLIGLGEAPVLRMIDSQLAFPDEVPSQNWQELRVSLIGGMVTLRRNAPILSVVVWGNSDAALLQSWNRLTWATADTTGGLIITEIGDVTAASFAASERLFPQ